MRDNRQFIDKDSQLPIGKSRNNKVNVVVRKIKTISRVLDDYLFCILITLVKNVER